MLDEQTLPSKDSIESQSPSVIAAARSLALRRGDPVITWDKLPADFILPDDPVDNVDQTEIAASLTELLSIVGLLSETAQTRTRYNLIATVDGKTIAIAADWVFLNNITVPIGDIERSYTPYHDGDVPFMVLEFVSDIDGSAYSLKPANPMGKWYFYEQILKVPYYGIFDPSNGNFEVCFLGESGRYDRHRTQHLGPYWIAPINLSIGTWKGERSGQKGYWPRFWDAEGDLVRWDMEKLEQQRLEDPETTLPQVEVNRPQTEADCYWAEEAERAHRRADRLAQRLRDLGVDPED